MNLFIRNCISSDLVIFCFLFIGINACVFAQRNTDVRTQSHKPQQEVPKIQFVFPVIQNYDGTYQFLLKKRKNISIHKTLLQHIKGCRKKKEDVLISVSSFCDVIILSEDKISSHEFVPFSNPYLLL